MNPLVDACREVLRASGPLRPERIRRELRLVGRNVPEEQVERALRERPDLFRPTGDGSWDLAERATTPEPPSDSDRDVDHLVDPLVAGAICDEFVVVDVETTGTDPSTDEIVQVAAARFRGGSLVGAFNRYTRPTHAVLAPSLKVRMGWGDVPESELSTISSAIEELDRFVAGSTVVAWNAQFDGAMLGAAGWTPPHLVDGLAVAMLAEPIGPHRLSGFGHRHGIECPPTQDVPLVGDVALQEQAHDALWDVALTGAVHIEMCRRLREGLGPVVADLVPDIGPIGSDPAHVPPPADRGTARPSKIGLENLVATVEHGGRQSRAPQAEATALADRALRGDHALVEAPTGTGKTLAYVSAALAQVAEGQRVVLVTAMKNLQDQLLDEIDEVRSALDLGVSVAVVKGGDNYLCRRRLQAAVDRCDSDDTTTSWILAVLVRLLDVHPLATREDVPGWILFRFPQATPILDEVAVACRHAGCPRPSALEMGNQADLVVMNQVHWVRPPEELSVPSVVVIDEAHDLEQMASLALTEGIGTAEFHALCNRLLPTGRRGLLESVRRPGLDIGPARQLVRRLRRSVSDARISMLRFATAITSDVTDQDGGSVRLRRSPRLLHPAAWTNASDSIREITSTLKDLGAELFALAPQADDPLQGEDLASLAAACFEQVDLIYELIAVREAAFVYYLELEGAERPGWRLARTPIEIGPRLADHWDTATGLLLISATLQTGDLDFAFVIDRLGLRGRLPGGAHVVGTDFPFDQNIVFGIARWIPALPVPRFMPEFEAAVAEELEALARFGDGRLLALFTAKKRLRHAYEAIAEPLAAEGLPVLAQGDGNRTELLNTFRDRPESVLLGTRSFWQGIDVQGQSLSFLAIEKLPYAHVKDPITEARLAAVQRAGGSEFEDFLLPQMIVTFKQGFGRLMRQHTDRGAVLLLDRRLHTKPYQQRVLASLPGFVPRSFDAELDRRAFYEHIDATLPGLVSDAGRQVLDALPQPALHLGPMRDVAVSGSREERRPAVLEALEDAFGFSGFRSQEQEELFWRIHDGEEVIGLLPTGAGKSLPFQLSALLAPGVTLVISPLVALMRDQVESLLDRGIRRVGALVGAMSADERDEVLRLTASGEIRLLYVAPERLRDPVFLDKIAAMPLRRLVVDEAHCVSLWGPSFRPDFLAIRPALDAAGHQDVPVAALTATATPEIEGEIRSSLRIEGASKVATSFGRPNLRFAVLGPSKAPAGDRFGNRKSRLRLLIRILTAAERSQQCAIVYTPTVREAEGVTTQLRQVGLLARAYHGRLDAFARQDVEELFRNGELDVVVATKAFGMGIDRPDVRYVIHLGFPADLESFYQEAGRAGRDGEPAWCLLLTIPPRDRGTQEWFITNVERLDGPLVRAHEYLLGEGPGLHHVDLEELGDVLGIEETETRVVLHYLDAAGAISRGTDQTQRARVLLLQQLEDSKLQEALEDAGAVEFVGVEVDLFGLADALGQAPVEVEERLLVASGTGRLVYRPIHRLARVEVHAGPTPTPDTRPIIRQMLHKLDQMEAFTTSTVCRQVTLRSYLGETDVGPCGMCDICLGSSFPRPWMDVTADSVPSIDTLLDVQLMVLAAAHWNQTEAATGRNPYGRVALSQVLAGDRHGLGYNRTGVERERRIRRAEASPYWGALALVTNPRARIDEAVDELLTAAELEEGQHDPTGPWASGGTYVILKLTESGTERLDRGGMTQ